MDQKQGQASSHVPAVEAQALGLEVPSCQRDSA